MKRAIVNPEKCRNCNPCMVKTKCPKNAIIRETANDKPWVDFYCCSGCLLCKGYCKNKAVEEISQPCDGKARKGW